MPVRDPVHGMSSYNTPKTNGSHTKRAPAGPASTKQQYADKASAANRATKTPQQPAVAAKGPGATGPAAAREQANGAAVQQPAVVMPTLHGASGAPAPANGASAAPMGAHVPVSSFPVSAGGVPATMAPPPNELFAAPYGHGSQMPIPQMMTFSPYHYPNVSGPSQRAAPTMAHMMPATGLPAGAAPGAPGARAAYLRDPAAPAGTAAVAPGVPASAPGVSGAPMPYYYPAQHVMEAYSHNVQFGAVGGAPRMPPGWPAAGLGAAGATPYGPVPITTGGRPAAGHQPAQVAHGGSGGMPMAGPGASGSGGDAGAAPKPDLAALRPASKGIRIRRPDQKQEEAIGLEEFAAKMREKTTLSAVAAPPKAASGVESVAAKTASGAPASSGPIATSAPASAAPAVAAAPQKAPPAPQPVVPTTVRAPRPSGAVTIVNPTTGEQVHLGPRPPVSAGVVAPAAVSKPEAVPVPKSPPKPAVVAEKATPAVAAPVPQSPPRAAAVTPASPKASAASPPRPATVAAVPVSPKAPVTPSPIVAKASPPKPTLAPAATPTAEPEEGELAADEAATPTSAAATTRATSFQALTAARKRAAAAMQDHAAFLANFKEKTLGQLKYPEAAGAAPDLLDDKRRTLHYSRALLLALKDVCTAIPADLSPDAPRVGSFVGGSGRGRGGARNLGPSMSGMSRSGSHGGMSSGGADNFGGRSAMFGRAMTQGGPLGSSASKRGGFQIGNSTIMMGGGRNMQLGGGPASAGILGSRYGGGGRGSRSMSQRGSHGSGSDGPSTPTMPRMEVSENAWRPTKSLGLAGRNIESSREDQVRREMRSLLNKLTLERFDAISGQILNLGLETQELLEVVVQLIFDKATDEPNFAGMYAQLCQFLFAELPAVQPWIRETAQGKKEQNKFRTILLSCCQTQFEEGAKWSTKTPLPRAPDQMTTEEKEEYLSKEEKRFAGKRRALGNIMFSGELFKTQMIGRNIMHRCVEQLLRDISDPDEEDVESLCKLLATIGPQLDDDRTRATIDKYFERIQALSQNKAKLSSRIRFMCLDLMEQRRSGWRSRQKKEGPKTIGEIREQAEQEARERAVRERQSRSMGGRMDRRDRDRGSRGGYGDSTRSSDGWTVQVSGGGDRGGRSSRDGSSGSLFGGPSSGPVGPTNLMRKSGSGSGSSARPNFLAPGVKLMPQGSMGGGGKPRSASGSASGGGLGASGGSGSSDANARSDGPTKNGNLYELLRSAHAGGDEPSTGGSAAAGTRDSGATRRWTAEEISRRIKNLVGEYVSDSVDDKEATETVREMALAADQVPLLVETVVNQAVEAKLAECTRMADLLALLYGEQLIGTAGIVTFMQDFMAGISDLYIDVHSVFKHTGQLLARLLAEDALSLEDVWAFTAEVRESPQNAGTPEGPMVIGETLAALVALDNARAWYMWRGAAAAHPLQAMWPAGGDAPVDAWVAKYGLGELVAPFGDAGARSKAMEADEAAALADRFVAEEDRELRDSPLFAHALAASFVESLGRPKAGAAFTREDYDAANTRLRLFAPAFVRVRDELAGDAPALALVRTEILFALQQCAEAFGVIATHLENWVRLVTDAEIVDRAACEQWKADDERLQSSKDDSVRALTRWFRSLETE